MDAITSPSRVISIAGLDDPYLLVDWDLAEVGSWLSSVYKGWCNYHAVPLNSTRLNQFRAAIQKLVENSATQVAESTPDDLGQVWKALP